MRTIIFSFFLMISFALSAQTINLNTTYTSSTSITPFGSINSISSLNITGSATLLNDAGIVRLILVDNNLNEYLLYEGQVFSMTGNTMSFTAYTDESQYLNNIKPSSILIIAKNATVTLNSIQYVTTVSANTLLQTQTLSTAFYKTKIDARIATMNTRLAQLGYTWTAKTTGDSYMSYSKKRAIYGLGHDDFNNYSEEHYAYGPLDLPPLSQPLSSFPSTSRLKSNVAISFDWRFRHGAMNINSPYYNAHEGCSGWINQMRDQLWEENSCGTCVHFGTVAMIENVMNIYYNRHIDYDLSEKAMAICNYDNKAACDGDGFSFPLTTITTDGLMKESCYPYPKPNIRPYNMDEPCSAKSTAYNNCTDKELVKVNPNLISTPVYLPTINDNNVVEYMAKLVKYGPFYTGNDGHAFCLVGWVLDLDNNVHWYYKNSNFDQTKPEKDGIDMAAKDELTEIGYLKQYAVPSPTLAPLFTSNYTESDRVCVDMDGDGYFNWGIGPKPATCPPCAPDIEDGDDWNTGIGEVDDYGQPKIFVPLTIPTQNVSSSITWNGENVICGDLVIKNNSTLTLGSAGSIKMQAGRKLTIEGNSSLVIQGGKVSMGSIVVNSGGTLTLNADATTGKEGIIELCNKVSSLTVNGVFNHNKGSVNIVNPFDPK